MEALAFWVDPSVAVCKAARGGRGRRGIALINVLIFAFIMVAVLTTATSYVSNTARAGRRQQWDQQAYQVALAGINHGIAFLNKQVTQPVTVFDPQSVPSPNPDDGIDVVPQDERLGLVGEFPIDEGRGLWGRYELARSSNAPSRTGKTVLGPAVPLYAGAGLYPASNNDITWRATDLSPRMNLADGQVWRLRAKAYVWQKTGGGGGPWGSQPPLKSLTLQADVARLTMTSPKASIVSNRSVGPGVELDPTVSTGIVVTPVSGGSYFSIQSTYASVLNTTSVPLGTTSLGDTSLPAKADDLAAEIFGLPDIVSLKPYADAVYSASNPIPSTISGSKFFYHDGNMELDGQVLNGSGVLVVDGSLLVKNGFHKFNGLIFVKQGFTMSTGSRFELFGSLVGCSNLNLIKGSASGITKIQHDSTGLNAAKSVFDRYRLRASTMKVVD